MFNLLSSVIEMLVLVDSQPFTFSGLKTTFEALALGLKGIFHPIYIFHPNICSFKSLFHPNYQFTPKYLSFTRFAPIKIPTSLKYFYF